MQQYIYIYIYIYIYVYTHSCIIIMCSYNKVMYSVYSCVYSVYSVYRVYNVYNVYMYSSIMYILIFDEFRPIFLVRSLVRFFISVS